MSRKKYQRSRRRRRGEDNNNGGAEANAETVAKNSNSLLDDLEAADVHDSNKNTGASHRGGRKRHRNENEHRADQTDIRNATNGKARTFLILRCICLCHMHFYAFMFYPHDSQ